MLRTSFNHGIWCDKLNNRSDLDSYQKACRQIENFEIFPHGGVTFRPGFEYKMEAASNTTKSRLISYQHSGGASYIIEVGHNIINIYSGTTLKGLKATSITEDMLDELDWSQAGDDLYLTSKHFPPSRLIRDSDTSWDFVDIGFNPLPQRTKRIDVGAAVTLSSVSGNGVSFTASAPTLQAGWVGKWLIAKSPHRGRGIIIEYTSSTAGKVDIIETFSNVTIPSGYVAIDGHGTGTLNPNRVGPEGTRVSVVASLSLFSSSIVGCFLELHGGFIRVTSQSSVTNVSGEIVKLLSSDAATPSWFISSPEWQTAYPQTLAFFENRMFYGESTEKPGYIWGSEMHILGSFTPSAEDTYSLMYRLQGEESQKIQWMVGGKILTIGTANGLWSIGQDRMGVPITPSNPMLNKLSSLPSAKIKPALMESSVIIVQRNKEKIFDVNVGSEGREPNDLTIYAEPFSPTNTVLAVAAQKTPQQIIWTIDSTGNMWGLNYNTSQEISSWFKVTTPTGDIESIATLPVENGPDELWVIVKRDFNGTILRSIEKRVSDQYLDCSATYSGNTVSLLTGFTHLPNGTVVGVVTEEEGYIGKYSVNASGQIDISTHSSASARAGIEYTGILQTMNWGAISQNAKPSYCKLRRGVNVNLSLLDTQCGKLACQVEQDGDINYYDIFEDTRSTPWSGTIEKDILTGSGKEIYFYIKQDQPLPISVLAISVEIK